jgi:hypothetical protein
MTVMNDEVVWADPVLRKRAVAILLVALALLGIGSYALAVLWPR